MPNESEQATRTLLPDDDEPETLIKPYPGTAATLDVTKPQPATPAAPAIHPTSSRLLLLLLGVAIIIALAIGGGYWWGSFTSSRAVSSSSALASLPAQSDNVQMPAIGDLLRPHYFTSIGDRPLSHVSYSDGMAPYSDVYLHQHHNNLQRIWYQDQPSGCDVARISSDKIWFVTHAPAIIAINGQTIARINQDTIPDGYSFDWLVKIGDDVCLNGDQSGTMPSSFYLWIGSDIPIWQDSHCYRGNCVQY
jgi:hypothetical protein